MRIVFLLVLVVGIATAGYATLLIKERFDGYQNRVAQLERELQQTKNQIVETVPVVVSSRRLNYAHELAAEDLKVIEWPKAGVPENVFSTIEELIENADDEVRYIRRTIDLGEPLLSTKVTDFGEDIGVTTLLEPGTRAFAIRVDVASGVSGFIQPGDEVDIYWTGNSNGQTITRLIMEKVKIIAIDQQANQDSQRPTVARTITLQVSPSVVANLVQFQTSGKLTLSLRGVLDTTTSGPIEVDTSTLIGNEISEVVEERICTRKVRRGVTIEEVVIPCED